MTSLPKALAALALAFGLAGCSNEPAATDANAPKPDTTAPAVSPGPAVVPSPTPPMPETGKDAMPKGDEPKGDQPKGDATKGDAPASPDAPKLEAPEVKGDTPK